LQSDGGISLGGSPANATRIAPDVPIINAILSFVVQPAPMLFAAPSPTTLASLASANAGQRNVNVSERRKLIVVLISGNVSGERLSASTKSQSQSHVC